MPTLSPEKHCIVGQISSNQMFEELLVGHHCGTALPDTVMKEFCNRGSQPSSKQVYQFEKGLTYTALV